MKTSFTTEAFRKIADAGINLSEQESYDVFNEIMDGVVSPELLSAFLCALKIKGETVDEVVGGAKAMRKKAKFINAGASLPIDTCGTGGDGRNTFNISTTSAFIIAGAGVAVAKHGNRSATSKCGSADVLAELGFNLNVRAEIMEHCLQMHGIAFLFAPQMHPAMKYASGVRKILGVRTIFNLLGPLVNPAGAVGQIVGVFDKSKTEFIAECLRRLGVRRAFVFHSYDGLDEISACAPTKISELKSGEIKTYEFNPLNYIENFGNFSELEGNSPRENAMITLDVLTCKQQGTARDICILNASAGIVASGKVDKFSEAIALACDSLNSGKAYNKLKTLIEFSKQ